jgi:hypothetical protein
MKMRSLCWLVVPALAAIVAYFATSRRQLPSPTLSLAQQDPAIEYPSRLDLGEHEIGEQIVAPFVIANRGGSELVIDQIHSNCSCTGMEQIQNGHYERVESLHLKAGDQVPLVMRVSVRGVPAGAKMLNLVEFRSNDPAQALGQIEAVVGPVSRGVSLSPAPVVFGTVPVGAEVRYVLDVRDTAVPPRAIERISSTRPSRVAVRLLPAAEGPRESESHPDGRVIGQVEVVVETGSPGEVNEAIQVQLAGEVRDPDAAAVVGRVAAALELLPSLLVLPRNSGGGPIYSATCICRSTNGEPLVVSVDSIPSGFKAEVLADGVPEARTIRIVWDPQQRKATAEDQGEQIRLRAKAGKNEAVLELQVLLQEGGR